MSLFSVTNLTIHVSRDMYSDSGSANNTEVEFSDQQMLHGVRHMVMSISLLLISVLCAVSNALICCVILRGKLYLYTFHATLFLLHAGSWALGVLGIVLSACMVYSEKCVLSEPLCTMYGFIIAWLGIGCILSIAVISYEWYRKLSCLESLRHPRAKWHIVFRLGTIWFLSFVVACPPLFGWNRYTVEVYSMPCSVDWESSLLSDKLYVAYIFTLGLIIPLTVILFSYGRIIQIMRTIANRRATNCPYIAAFVSRHHVKMMQMLFTMFLVFCITWFPYGIQSLIIVCGYKRILSEDGAIAVMMLAKASICTYPIIYAYMNNEIQQSLKAWKNSCWRGMGDFLKLGQASGSE